MLKFIKGLSVESFLVLKTLPKLIKITKRKESYSQQEIHNIVNSFCKNSLKLNGQNIIIHGKENLPNEPSLFVSNHRSMIDGIIMPSVVDTPIGMIIAKEPVYENIPIVNKWTKLSKCLYIDRNSARNAVKTINEASNIINSGVSIGAFPEGHLTDENDMLDEFKDGLFKIAIKSQCPVVPIVIEGSEKSFIVDKSLVPIVNDADIHVYILRPIKAHIGKKDFKSKNLSRFTRSVILDKIYQHRYKPNKKTAF